MELALRLWAVPPFLKPDQWVNGRFDPSFGIHAIQRIAADHLGKLFNNHSGFKRVFGPRQSGWTRTPPQTPQTVLEARLLKTQNRVSGWPFVFWPGLAILVVKTPENGFSTGLRVGFSA